MERTRLIGLYTQAGKIRRVKGEAAVGKNVLQLAFTEDEVIIRDSNHSVRLSVYCLWAKFKTPEKCDKTYRKIWEEATTIHISKAFLIAMFSIWRHDKQTAVKSHLNLRGFKQALSILQRELLSSL